MQPCATRSGSCSRRQRPWARGMSTWGIITSSIGLVLGFGNAALGVYLNAHR